MELKSIKGLGTKRIEILNERGIMTARDLVYAFPKTYFDLESKDTFIEDGKYKLLKCEVIGDVKVSRIRKNFSYSYVNCLDLRNFPFKAIWYNQPYIKNAIKNGDTLYLYGKNSNTKHGYFIVSTFKNKNKIDDNIKFLPVYKTFKGIGQSIMLSSISEALAGEELESIIPQKFEQDNLSLSLKEALKITHFPTTIDELEAAKERIDIEKYLPLIKLNNDISKQKIRPKWRNYSNFSQVLSQFCSFLPYTLTESQLKTLSEIEADLKGETMMNRLVQGDVGSGKTIVALISAAAAISSGHSAIFVAPTEILSKQHFSVASQYFKKLGLNVRLLTASTRPLERRQILSEMRLVPTLLVGTHSCFSDDVDLSNVSMLIIDEQHRFGVKQRSTIINRAAACDLLMLSATPIPRSMEIVYFGSLALSKLDQMPFNKKIQTNLVNMSKEESMWNFIGEKINDGSKVYVVCANIDDADDDCYEGLSVNSMYETLCDRFSKDKVLMAHGKLDSREEESVLEKFRGSQYKILVSTTIVEVGVDISEADIMVIVSPEKFGLSTLHQLRGRIGRAGQVSYCFCLTRNVGSLSLERIKFFKENLNGFDIAEFDYTSRGAGDILSTKQHGRIDNPFDLIKVETLKKTKELFDKLSSEYKNTDFLIEKSGIDKTLSDIGLN